MKSTAQRDRDAFWKAKAKSEKQRARMRSFWVPAWLSELVSWEKIREDYRRAKELLSLGDKSNLKTWIQTTCAEPWVEEQPPTIRGNELLSRAEAYDAEVPSDLETR